VTSGDGGLLTKLIRMLLFINDIWLHGHACMSVLVLTLEPDLDLCGKTHCTDNFMIVLKD
jgi:hypothetical protein